MRSAAGAGDASVKAASPKTAPPKMASPKLAPPKTSKAASPKTAADAVKKVGRKAPSAVVQKKASSLSATAARRSASAEPPSAGSAFSPSTRLSQTRSAQVATATAPSLPSGSNAGSAPYEDFPLSPALPAPSSPARKKPRKKKGGDALGKTVSGASQTASPAGSPGGSGRAASPKNPRSVTTREQWDQLVQNDLELAGEIEGQMRRVASVSESVDFIATQIRDLEEVHSAELQDMHHECSFYSAGCETSESKYYSACETRSASSAGHTPVCDEPEFGTVKSVTSRSLKMQTLMGRRDLLVAELLSEEPPTLPAQDGPLGSSDKWSRRFQLMEELHGSTAPLPGSDDSPRAGIRCTKKTVTAGGLKSRRFSEPPPAPAGVPAPPARTSSLLGTVKVLSKSAW